VRTPVADVVERWLTVAAGQRPVVHFDTAVSTVAIGRRTTVVDGASVAVPTHAAGGSVRVAAAARPWERLGSPVPVARVPESRRPVVLAHPSPGARIEPLTTIRLTLSEPIASAIPHGLPSFAPSVAGRWTRTDSHTLVFRPSGFGAPFATTETVRLPTPVTV